MEMADSRVVRSTPPAPNAAAGKADIARTGVAKDPGSSAPPQPLASPNSPVHG